MTGLLFINSTADNLLTLPYSILYTNSNRINQPEKKEGFFCLTNLLSCFFPSCAEIRLGIFQIKSVGTH